MLVRTGIPLTLFSNGSDILHPIQSVAQLSPSFFVGPLDHFRNRAVRKLCTPAPVFRDQLPATVEDDFAKALSLHERND
jgi:hypothetical protein